MMGLDKNHTHCITKTEDLIFGDNAWIYCRQHLKPHLTGWCSVGNQDKIGLGLFGQENVKAAYQKCQDWGLKIYNPNEMMVEK